MDHKLSQPKLSATPTRVIVFLFIALALIALMGLSLGSGQLRKNQDKKGSIPDISKKIENLSPHTLIYGTWDGNNSTIIAYDLSTGREGIIAQLPASIKKVTVLSNNELLYIDNTDVRDHGTEITKYNLTNKQTSAVVKASSGYSIDDYVISPDHSKIATWEVQMDSDGGTLLNGKSRVYSATTANNSKNLIYDEASTSETPVHYPRAILNDGTVFTDRFMPNDGAGWAYGMSVSNFNGTERKDLDNMKNGTYGTQPVLSPNGKYLVFAGYDGSKGVGDSIVEGFRRAVLSPNTVELLDTATLVRTKLKNLSTANTYLYTEWNDSSSDLIIATQAPNEEQSGLYSYNISQAKPVLIPQTSDTSVTIRALSDTIYLSGVQDTSSSTIGNLGDNYAAPYTSFAIVDSNTDKITKLKTHANLMQLIAVLPATSFGSFQTIIERNEVGKDKLQLQTFTIKPELASTRITQQSNNCALQRFAETGKPANESTEDCVLCRDLAAAQCGLSSSATNDIRQTSEGRTCFAQKFPQAKRSGECYDSPLYLYGQEGKQVTVNILTPVSNADPAQSGSFIATLKTDGKMTIGGKSYDSVDFNYNAALRKITPPTKGVVVKKSEVKKALQNYATQFGLNKNETQDLVEYGTSVASAPYVFISFFDEQTSKAILPITFDPKPDVYHNIVFYFKNLASPYSVEKPKITPLERRGFTAVEISGIVE